MLVNPIEKENKIKGPTLIKFFKGAKKFPAFHFYDLMKDYGDVVECGPYFYLINHPDIAKDILNRDQKDFSQKDFIGRRVTTLFGHGMVTSQGDLWSSQRRLLNPVFRQNQLNKQIDEAIEQIDVELDKWQQLIDDKDQVNLVELMGTMAIMTSGKLLFHFDLSKYEAKIKEIVKIGTTYIAQGLPFYIPFWIPSPSHIKIKNITKQIDKILLAIVENRQIEAFENDDMAGILIQNLGNESSSEFEKRVMIDEMKTMLAGGYFPISCSLSMIWYALGENLNYYKKMCDEIRSKPTDYTFGQNFYKDFPITTSIIFETMRLYPVAFSIWRKAKVDFKSNGFLIPQGKSVCISLYNIHRHHELWENPNSFMPERFTNNKGKKERPRHYFMPFGWGNRKCIGDHYSMMIVFLTIIRTLQKFNLDIYHEPLQVRRAALICPKRVNAKIKLIF